MSDSNYQKVRFYEKLNKNKNELKEPFAGKGLLNTDDRISEILTGIILTLTFTCTFSFIKSDTTSVTDMLTGAICSTVAWGFIDGVMYLFMTLIDKEHNLTFLNFVRKSKDVGKVRKVIVDALPATISKLMHLDEIESIRQKIQNSPEPSAIYRLKFSDYKTAGEIFILVVFATIPISIPFVIIKDLQIAVRVSNIVAILMMYFCGWALAKYAGRNRIIMGILTSLIGITLVALTIALGG